MLSTIRQSGRKQTLRYFNSVWKKKKLPFRIFFVPVRPRVIRKYLKELDPDSAVGPDGIASIVLRKMYMVLETPITIIVRKIVQTSIWPELWKSHWIYPLFKKGLVSNAHDYRGIHLTSQLSKIAERVLARIFITPMVKSLSLYGENQFAYTEKRGARDVLAFIVLSSLLAFARGKKLALYQADVSGAFDRVDSEILLEKCRRARLHPKLIRILSSWLIGRSASVVVGSTQSPLFPMTNMVFQGTVLGPL